MSKAIAALMPAHDAILSAIAEDFAGENFTPLRATEGIPRMVVWRDASIELPDDDTSVMVFSPEDSEPVWIGFHDADVWRCPSGMPLKYRVTHWAHLPEPPTR